MPRRIRATAAYVAAFCLFAALVASTAFAQTDGEGLAGETDDKMVTFFSLGVLIFLVAFVVIMSLIQHQLEKRHDHSHPAPKAGW